jgi:dUTP pyrophosphatase
MRVKKLDPRAIAPTYGSDGSAGFDFYSIEEVKIPAGETQLIRTGWAFEIPDGCFGKIFDRSSMAFKNDLECSAGVIDSDFRGEIKVLIRNHGKEDKVIAAGERFAQMVIKKYERVDFEEVTELSESSRGSGGFGSTGR